MAGKTHAAAMLEALSDGKRWSTHELVTYGAGYAAHSRAADLRKLGYAVKSHRQNVPGENPVYFYELQSVPAEATRLEELVDPTAASRLQAMRVAQGDSIFHHPPESGSGIASRSEVASSPDRAGGPGVTEAPNPPLSPPAAATTPRAAAGIPTRTAAWIDDLNRELAGIDDEIAHLRSQLFLTPEDSVRVDLLLARGDEVRARLDGLLEERAA